MLRLLAIALLALAIATSDHVFAADGRMPAGLATASGVAVVAPATPPRGGATLMADAPASGQGVQVIDATEIATLLQRSAARDGRKNMQVELAPGRYEMQLPPGAPRRVDVEDFWIDPRQGRFTARLVGAAGHPQAVRLDVSGRAFEMVAVPMLVRDTRTGAAIRHEDLEWSETDASRLGRDVLVEAADLVGKTAKRPLKAGRALRAGDVAETSLVAKGDAVAMRVAAQGMQLTAIGQALEPGGKGDTIRVRNAQSNRIVEGTVTGTGAVSVALGSAPLRAERRSR